LNELFEVSTAVGDFETCWGVFGSRYAIFKADASIHVEKISKAMTNETNKPNKLKRNSNESELGDFGYDPWEGSFYLFLVAATFGLLV
jgi:hypothetical protein